MMLANSLVAIFPLLAVVEAATIEHWWNISYATANPDSLQQRRVIGVNGSWPPPPLEATQGDILIVHAYNGLGDPTIGTALHTHGMMFNGTNYYDGAVQTTQCPIPAGETMDYHIDTGLQTGTYWIHGHHDGQYTDGLRAPFVIHPATNVTGRSDNTTWDAEYTIVMGDWYHREFADLLTNDFLNWKNPTGAEPVPVSAVIYVAQNGSYINTNAELSNGTGVNDDASLLFQPGLTYRIRMVNTAALAMFYITMDNHTMSIIETDGVEIEPYEIDVLSMSVAQRYSILVTAKNETDTNYAMMFMQNPDMYDTVPDDLVLNNTVQIVYDSANPLPDPITVDDFGTVNDTEFVPVQSQAMYDATVNFELNAFFDTYDDGTNRASFNNVTYQMPNVPSIFTALSMGNSSLTDSIYGAQTNAFAYKHLEVVQLTVFNWDAGFHPFHLHGHEFQVVHKSFDVTSNDTTINPPFQEVQDNPARRDTIMVPPSGSVTLRWVADNPGAWMFHCHIDWHLSSGLAAIFIEAPDKFQTNTTIPQQLLDQCKFWNMATTGNAVGLNSTTDLSGQPLGPYPIVMGWTPKAIGALAGCVITALIGFLTVVWYGWGELDEGEIEEEIKRKVQAKQNRPSLAKRLAGRFGGSN